MLSTDPELPNDLRWLLALGLFHLHPWFIFRTRDEYNFASEAFGSEDVLRRSVLTFARRHDCDDFAGLEIVNGSITSEVIYFHAVFGSSSMQDTDSRTWDICCGTYPDVFVFLADVVAPAMREWALGEEAADIEPDWRGTVEGG